MAARSVLTFRLTGATASLLHKRLLSSTVSKPPPLPGRISISRYTAPALSHPLRVTSPIRINQVRCQVSLSGSSYSPLNSGSNFNDRPRIGTKLFPSGCDFKHWLIVINKPGGAKVLGRYLGFGCAIDEKTSSKLEGLPGVLFVLPDSYLDAENKDYEAELFVNGEIVQRSPERQRRVEPVPMRAQCRPILLSDVM